MGFRTNFSFRFGFVDPEGVTIYDVSEGKEGSSTTPTP